MSDINVQKFLGDAGMKASLLEFLKVKKDINSSEDRFPLPETRSVLARAMYDAKDAPADVNTRLEKALLQLADPAALTKPTDKFELASGNTYYHFAYYLAGAYMKYPDPITAPSFRHIVYEAIKTYLIESSALKTTAKSMPSRVTPAFVTPVWGTIEAELKDKSRIDYDAIKGVNVSEHMHFNHVLAYLDFWTNAKYDRNLFDIYNILYNLELSTDTNVNVKNHPACDSVFCSQFVDVCVYAIEYVFLAKLLGKLLYSANDGGIGNIANMSPPYESTSDGANADKTYPRRTGILLDRFEACKNKLKSEGQRIQEAYRIYKKATEAEATVRTSSTDMKAAQDEFERERNRLVVLVNTEENRRTAYHRAWYGTVMITVVMILFIMLFTLLLHVDDTKFSFDWLTPSRFYYGIVGANGLIAIGLLLYEMIQLLGSN